MWMYQRLWKISSFPKPFTLHDDRWSQTNARFRHPRFVAAFAPELLMCLSITVILDHICNIDTYKLSHANIATFHLFESLLKKFHICKERQINFLSDKCVNHKKIPASKI